MSDFFVGEIRIFAGNYAPEGWLKCDGSLVSIQQYPAYYSLVGTTYGGDGVNTCGIPDMRGRLPIGQGQGTGLTARTIGQKGGDATVVLTPATMPSHTHSFTVSGNPGTANTVSSSAALAVPAPQTGGTMYAYAPPNATGGTAQTFADGTITTASGGGQAHYNVMPFLALTYIIAVSGGLYPQRAN